MKHETRALPGRLAIERRTVDGKAIATLTGHAAVFYREGDPATEFDFGYGRERMMPGCFDHALKEKQDVRALWNHDTGVVLGRTKPGTLRLSVDDTGLCYECDLPDTQAARDLAASVERGDVDGSSFGFSVRRNADGSAAEKWEKPLDGKWVRMIGAVDLFDVSPVTFPAYDGATVGLRALGDISDLKQAVTDLEKRAKDADTKAQEDVRKQQAEDLDLQVRMAEVCPIVPDDI